MKYDLLTETWIPVDGRSVGLLEFVDLARDTEMVICPPLEQAAIIRLFVAVLVSSCGSPSREDVSVWLKDGIPKDRIKKYLIEHAKEFDLMGGIKPFMQVSQSDYVSNSSFFSWRPPLVMNGAQKNNSILFNKCGDWDAPKPMSPDRAARLLLAHNTFVTGGGKVGKSAGKAIYLCGGPLGGRSCYMLIGDTIEKTAIMNSLSDKNIGRPLWETGDIGIGKECDPEGLLVDLAI
jgi:CRISPR type I-E-associated protein CasA/Cse1